MFRGLSVAASGMLTEMDKQTIISNNLANVDTAGFKKDVFASQSFPLLLMQAQEDNTTRSFQTVSSEPIGFLGTGAEAAETTIDFSQGSMKQTENELDFALMGDGFFTVSTPGGERYTRNGSFTLDALGRLVNSDGYLVQGKGGTIQVGGGDLQVDKYGNISVDGQQVDSLKLVVFSQANALEKVGQNLFTANSSGSEAAEVKVMQGYLEASNVNVVQEMVEMIAALRAYQANQRAIRSEDEMLGKAINEVGRI